MNTITISVDAMGGDHGPSVVVPAALKVLAKNQSIRLILVGDQDVLEAELAKNKTAASKRLILQHASQTVEMDEPPGQALRSKKDSSMRVAINLVKENAANACVSAGNTGALMLTAHFVLKALTGINRPALISSFPTINKRKCMRMLDLGADVDAPAENLFQFAVMGSVLARAVDNIDKPKIYLLNIGSEVIKGNEQVKHTTLLLTNATMINYSGYIEGDEIFNGEADIVVCDGFVGNVALKTAEGSARFIKKLLQEEFRKNIFTRIIGFLSLPIMKALSKRIDPARFNGATLIGLQGIVIKSHGGANVLAFANAIEQAIVQAEKNIPQLIANEVEQLLKNSNSIKDE